MYNQSGSASEPAGFAGLLYYGKSAGVYCDVIFGSPKDECRGMGICKIDLGVTSKTNNKSCNRAKSLLRVIPETQSIALEFCKTAICLNLFRRIFSQETFILPETYYINRNVSGQFGLDLLKIPAGRYPILGNSETFVIVFSVITI